MNTLGRLCILVFFALSLSILTAVDAAYANAQPPVILHVKFKDTIEIHSVTGQAIDSELKKLKAKITQPIFKTDRGSLRAQYHTLKNSGHNVADLSRYYEIALPAGTDAKKTASALKKLPQIAEAYPRPKPTPTPATPNLTGYQGYRPTAPRGVDANFASTWPGAKGEHARIVDMEYSWHTNHEDLAAARMSDTYFQRGTPIDPFGGNQPYHGTAVIGTISSTDNGLGLTGIAPAAKLHLAPTNTLEYGWDVAGVIYDASLRLQAGDVILLEHQAVANDSDPSTLVPIEWYPAFYDAIKYATAKGIIVVEPAGNGGQNLDTYGSPFPAGKPDSGAIIVGASQSCDTQLARHPISSYGARVNLQGWGSCVATTGWWGGDSIIYDDGIDRQYTNGFGATSSAAALVAGAATSFSSAYQKLNNGTAPSPELVRSTLMNTGTPQVNPQTGKIGPQPNLAKALLATDRTPPTAPSSLRVHLSTTKKHPILNWTASNDNVGIAAYRIYRNNILIKTINPATSYIDSTVLAKKTYQYKLTAVDKAGRVSGYSNTVTISTP